MLPAPHAADVVPQSTADEARQRADRIRSGMRVLAEWQVDVITAYSSRDWDSLGYASWEAYLDGEFGEHRVRLPRDQRRELVASMAAAEMSTRAIAAAVGTSHETVATDIRAVGVKNLTPTGEAPQQPEPDPVFVEVSVIDEPAETAAAPQPARAPVAPPAAAPRRVVGIDGKTYTQTSQRAPQKPRTDVVAVVNRALLRAQEAARAADEINRQHLAGKTEEAAAWSRNLSASLDSLQRLQALLDGES